jgi:hypothetical protein
VSTYQSPKDEEGAGLAWSDDGVARYDGEAIALRCFVFGRSRSSFHLREDPKTMGIRSAEKEKGTENYSSPRRAAPNRAAQNLLPSATPLRQACSGRQCWNGRIYVEASEQQERRNQRLYYVLYKATVPMKRHPKPVKKNM